MCRNSKKEIFEHTFVVTGEKEVYPSFDSGRRRVLHGVQIHRFYQNRKHSSEMVFSLV